MKQKLFFMVAVTSLVFCVLATTSSADPEPFRERVEAGVAETVTVGKKSAGLRQRWQAEERLLADEAHALELELKLLEARSRKLQGYSQQRQEEILRLKSGLEDMAEIGIRLEPYLDDLAVKIKEINDNDLPFSLVERERRLADLNDALNGYDVDLAEKLRRLMEVLKIEAGFGRGFEVSEEVLNKDTGETAVRVLRLGRIGLYYLTLDGAKAGWFNRELKVWEELSGGYSEAIKEALRMALKQRAFDLVCLPVAGGKP